MSRKDWNIKIYHLLKFKKDINTWLIQNNKIEEFYGKLWKMIFKYPDQRFGQIFCNYFAPFYRDNLEGIFEEGMMKLLFWNCDMDPFFEESKETYEILNERV